ncbi:DUF1631 family protein [Hydrogenophaga sp.]|uniref:DUF1631 family protein n=1 Tax=Hydrogenophaga sp. TaxID=1904254 RepID=UPI002B93C712|nr:DUF1631 family protein [Hydrogenophaga sp.]HMP10812.1 DUF1631 family protein [Hydrogenophaga sp.]
MSAETPLLEQCFGRVLRGAPALLERLADEAVASLQASEQQGRDVRDRELLARAWWNLLQHKTALAQQFPLRLSHAFHHADSEGQTSSLARLSDSSLLSLVDDSEVSESLESARLIQALMPVVEQSLSMVDARMSSLIGLDTIHAEKNPLRPSVFVRALRDLMAEREPDAEVRRLWLQRMAPALGKALCQLYEQVALLLQKANVKEAGYRVRLVADSHPSQHAPLSTRSWLEGGQHESRAEADSLARSEPAGDPLVLRMGDLARESSPLRHEVMQAFLGGPEGAFDQPLDNAFYEQVRRELTRVDTLARLPESSAQAREQQHLQRRGLAPVDRPALEVGVGSELDAEQWGPLAGPQERSRVLLELKHQADKVSQAVGLDVVRKLVSQVAGDPLLLAPIREAVVALEPSLLRLAMDEPRYFSREDHPARQWIEEVAQRSFRYNDEYASEFTEFLEPLQEQVRQLNASGLSEPHAFSDALASLREQWAAADREEEERKRRQLQALHHAEARQELADQIAWEISNRPDVFNAPGVVLDFLYGSWALVIASDRLAHPEGGPDPSGYQKIISHLLWSTRREVTLKRPRQLFEVVPGMLKVLRKGLDELGKTAEETQTFFDALLKLHEPVLKLRRMRVQVDGAHSGPAPLEPDAGSVPPELLAPATAEQQKPRAKDQPWIGIGERHAAGFADTEPAEEEEPQDRADEGASDADDPVALLDRLHTGDWVDLFSAGHWLRAELVWSSSKGSLFMFTSRGGRAHTMTRRSCEKLLHRRLIRPVAARPVVAKALQNMTQPA